MSSIDVLKQIRNTLNFGIELKLTAYEMGRMSPSRLNDEAGKLSSQVKALTEAIEAIEKEVQIEAVLLIILGVIGSGSHPELTWVGKNYSKSDLINDLQKCIKLTDSLDKSDPTTKSVAGEL